MLAEDQLRLILPSLPLTTLHGPWSRVIRYHLLQGPPPNAPPGSVAQPLWPGGAARHGARFTPPGSFDTLYVASDAVTALLEARVIVLSPEGHPIAVEPSPWVNLTVDGVLANVLDVTDTAIQTLIQAGIQELTGDWEYVQSLGRVSPTQLLGRVAFDSGIITAVKYFSAKNAPGGTGLAIFTDRLTLNPANYIECIDPYNYIHQRLP